MDKFIVDEWIKYAEMDRQTAEFLLGMNPKPLEIICYLSQQSSEKILKAYLLSEDENPPKTHDLKLLRELCEKFDKEFNQIKAQCNRLTDYGVQPKYPFGLEIVEEYMKIAMKDAKKIMDKVKKIIEKAWNSIPLGTNDRNIEQLGEGNS